MKMSTLKHIPRRTTKVRILHATYLLPSHHSTPEAPRWPCIRAVFTSGTRQPTTLHPNDSPTNDTTITYAAFATKLRTLGFSEMGFFDNIMVGFDEGVTGLFGQWNLYTTGLVAALVAIVSYRIVSSSDADTHPMLLARQAQASPVRQEGESPVYRSHNAPHGMPLNSGLNVKDPGASKWSKGRDGDLRDVWRRAATGPSEEEGKPPGKGRILTVLGTESVIESKLGRSIKFSSSSSSGR
jgi:hypothetical protein